MTMSHLDYSILFVYLFIVIGMGWYFRTVSSRAEDFFLAGRSMGWFPVGLSVMVTMFSAINYLAFPNEVFGYGLYVTAALPVFFIVAWPVTKTWIPFFYEMKLTSAYEYLEKRFDRKIRSLSSGIFMLWRLFWMATALYASGRILSALTGVSEPVLILTGGIAATIYTFLGGMKAVMWTDVLQFFVLFGGIVLGVAYATGNGAITAVQKKGMAMGQLAAVIRSFPIGIPGLVTAGLFAATMSSIDSGINACSAAFVTDFAAGGFHRNRRLTVLLGVAATGMALILIPLTGRMGSLFMMVNKMVNATGSPLLALFLLGMFSRKANAPGVFAGGIVGVVASFAISLFYRPLALQYYAVLNLLATLLPCFIFSMIFRKHEESLKIDKLRYTWFEWRNRRKTSSMSENREA